MFDADWVKHGYMDDAVRADGDLGAPAADHRHDRSKWCAAEGRTPLIYIEIPGEGDRHVLLYGHLDKQPEMTGWFEDLGPWTPVLKGDKLYGRGGADDGYAASPR
jgi:acetylornithine deacetylase/succinyl-diaminopimelate desuccinylase-like protein